ncbi:right-handed parallel beta-helix repeat-containing protein [Neobacillus kokaensis]|uniref:Right handed beta helix domain-containing protein n=1 Tax=Neobacillus kokaensis TaxID=2759023 RepID=A0ABQ3MYU1_9BACI|nr:right-handed parallel beta-helix repeat-containing protein [Neobacillus kokaensis]GHH97449.1 hypothetical protein AM1BK_09920 [Neobacillus kokaensis]
MRLSRFSKNTNIIIIFLILTASLFLGIWIFHNQKQDKITDNSKRIKVQKEIKKTYSFINVSDYGAVGDGKHNDTQAILNAIEHVKNGGNIIFDSNKTYLITETIKITKDINITTNGQKNATLLMGSNTKNEPVLYFTGKVKKTIEINNILKTRDIHINLPNRSGVDSNDLLLIESNKPWYFEPRTGTQNLHKGELHKIIGVNKSEVILAEGIWDAYDPQKENIKIKLIDPINISIEKINIIRKPSNDRTVGIKLEYGTNSSINRVSIKNSTAVGIYVVSSYRTNIENSKVTEANDKYSGYGIQLYGSSYSTIQDNRISGSRRGIDVSGQYPDYFSTVEFNSVYGGGKNELGLQYLTEDTQYGIGTHSTANFTVFRGNVLANLNYGVNIRSSNVTIKQNKFLGYFKGAAIILAFGRNVSIVDNETISGNNIPQIALKNNLPKSIKDFNAKNFLSIKRSYDLNNSEIQIVGNKALDISESFIKFLNDQGTNTTQIKKIQVLNNDIKQASMMPNRQPFYFIFSEFPLMANSSIMNKNKIVNYSMEEQVPVLKNFIESNNK